MSKRLGERTSDEVLNEGFSGYNSGVTAVAATATTIPIDSEHFPSTPTFTLSSGELSCGIDNELCEIAWKTSAIGASGSSRSSCEAWLEQNGVEVPGTRGPMYLRQANFGDSTGCQVFLTINNGDTLRIRAQRVQGAISCSFGAQRTALTVKRL